MESAAEIIVKANTNYAFQAAGSIDADNNTATFWESTTSDIADSYITDPKGNSDTTTESITGENGTANYTFSQAIAYIANNPKDGTFLENFMGVEGKYKNSDWYSNAINDLYTAVADNASNSSASTWSATLSQ